MGEYDLNRVMEFGTHFTVNVKSIRGLSPFVEIGNYFCEHLLTTYSDISNLAGCIEHKHS